VLSNNKVPGGIWKSGSAKASGLKCCCTLPAISFCPKTRPGLCS
jgi:hypothetical protein